MEIKIIKANIGKSKLLLNDYNFISGNKLIILYGKDTPTIEIDENCYIYEDEDNPEFCQKINSFIEINNINSLFLWTNKNICEIDKIILTLLESTLSKLFIYIKEDKNNEMH